MQHTRTDTAPLDTSRRQQGIAALDTLNATEFTALLADVFEHSPWVAERSAGARPFAGLDDLHRAMCAAVDRASEAEQLALLCAHPELAGRQAQQGELTAASEQEQSRAGLKALSTDEMQRMSSLNADYLARHGFPFIVCVGQHTKKSLFAEFERRVSNAPPAERTEAMAQVRQIAHLRLSQIFAD